MMMSRPGSGQVAGFVVDMLCTGMMDVADECGVPSYVFFPSSADYLGFLLYIQTFCYVHDEYVIELSNSDSELLVPTFVNPVPTKVFPSGFDTKEGLDYCLLIAWKFREAKAIIVNTFFELETHAIDSLSDDTSMPTGASFSGAAIQSPCGLLGPSSGTARRVPGPHCLVQKSDRVGSTDGSAGPPGSRRVCVALRVELDVVRCAVGGMADLCRAADERV